MPHRHLCACLAALTLVACGDIGTGPPKPAVILALNNPVSAQVGESVQLSVRITDEEGLAIGGVVVSWTAPSEVNVDPKESVTDLEGIASASLSLPRAPTTFVVSALAEGLPPAEFNVKWGARELAVIKQFQKAARGNRPIRPGRTITSRGPRRIRTGSQAWSRNWWREGSRRQPVERLPWRGSGKSSIAVNS